MRSYVMISNSVELYIVFLFVWDGLSLTLNHAKVRLEEEETSVMYEVHVQCNVMC